MPYIVCVNMPGYLPEQDPVAVTTLEETRESAFVATLAAFWGEEYAELAAKFRADCDDLPKVGGVIGPLPNGYVIDVQHVTWTELATLMGFYSAPQYDNEREELINAYNNKD